MIFFGDEGVVWVSQDCGHTIRALYQGQAIERYEFHPTEPQWGLASSIQPCKDTTPGCKVRRELFYTANLGNSWMKVAEYVEQFGWGMLDDEHIRMGIPKERILVVSHSRGQGHQDFSGGWSGSLDLHQSDDLFESKPTLLVKHGNRFSLSSHFLYVA